MPSKSKNGAVEPRPDGRWAVQPIRRSAADSLHDTKKDAMELGCELARKSGGEQHIKGAMATFRTATITVAPGTSV